MTTAIVDIEQSDSPEKTYTGGMIALVPVDPTILAVDGGEPPEQLHLTIAYLGDDVTDWDPNVTAAVHKIVRELTDPIGAHTRDPQPVPAADSGSRGPLTLEIFAWSQFNPNGGPNGQEPCLVYQFSGDGDLNAVENLAMDICDRVRQSIGDVLFPEQHPRFVPHVTAGYNLPADALSYTGPVVFDRLRVALADQITDYPLGGVDVVTASGIPDAPQECCFGDTAHPAVRSLIFNDGKRYVPVCDEHERQVRPIISDGLRQIVGIVGTEEAMP